MQNTNNTVYINKFGIINIKSEILYREAEDDLFFFNKLNSAQKKLEQAIKLTPRHLKSIIMCGDIYFLQGKIKKALDLYLKASSIKTNAKIYASIANCYKALNQYKLAVKYCDEALKQLSYDNLSFFSQVTELKIDSLLNLGQFNRAYLTFIQAKNILNSLSINIINNLNYDILREKIQKRKKLHNSKLRIV